MSVKQSEAAKLVMMLLAAYPHGKTNEGTSGVYEQMLLDLDFESASKAITRLIGTSKWLPTVAEIRSTATDLRLGPARGGGEAWADAIEAVRSVGRYGVPKWRDPVLGEAMRLWGSWRDFCDSPSDDPGGRARFIELYEQLATRARADVVSGIPLPVPKGARLPAQLTAGVGQVIAMRPASQFAGRKLSADEIESAMAEAK